MTRYILQLRYGCQSKTCTTPTCFSCRKALAQGAPVRRYNPTSARTLAIYLASQDNPERALCRNLTSNLPFPPTGKHPKITVQNSPPNQVSDGSNRQDLASMEQDGNNGSKTAPVSRSTVQRDGSDGQAAVPIHGKPRRKGFTITSLEEPRAMDHRSFVQNVFGTAAFKMVEWLTPRNLEILASSGGTNSEERGKDRPDPLPAQATVLIGGGTEVKLDEKSTGIAESMPFRESNAETKTTPSNPSQRPPTKLSTMPPTENIADRLSDSKRPLTSAPTHQTSANVRRRSPELVDPSIPKGILSLSPKKDSQPDIRPLAREMLPARSKRRSSQQTIITSPQLPTSEPRLSVDSQVSSDEAIAEQRPIVPVSNMDGEMQTSTSAEAGVSENDTEEAISTISSPVSTKDTALPQSLSRLSVEMIEFVCDILQTDDTDEKHFLQPQRVHDGLKRRQSNALLLKRRPLPPTGSSYPSGLRSQWHAFIEQSFFDVLCKPDSLLRSFSNDEKRLFDTQTIWYLMFRMTRVAPSLVFDSLWNVAGTLFLPPEKLEATYDWAKDSQSQKTVASKSVSNQNAAQVLNICLQALVAAAPLVTDASQLANMSRIRSDGLILRSKDSSAVEAIELCLQYEDAFSDEMAMRLARRVFAAIPTRRRYGELLEHHSIQRGEKADPDVLDSVLATFKSLDLGTPPMLNFPDIERDFHEKRVPTLILDWARTVLLQGWEGGAEIPNDGPLGGALAMIAAIYKIRKPLRIGDFSFRIEYFAERLDSVDMPLEWLDSVPNKRTVHLLDHPFLFQPSTLVTYFRAINYSRMNEAHETAKATYNLMRSTISEGNLMTDVDRRRRLSDRLSTAISKFIVLEIRRNNVLLDTFNSIWRREERELMRPLKIRLGEDGGEEGLDSGGVQQEFFRLAIAEALNPDYGAFTVDSRTKMTWFQPGSPEPLWKFELIGMIISLAIYNGLTLPVTFPKALYRKLLGQDVTELHHIEDGWPDLANGLTTLLEWDESEGLVEDIFARTYEFSVEQFGKPVSRQMGMANNWPQFEDLNYSSNPTDAPMVTNENRNSYVSDYIKWLTEISIRPQFMAFQSGFFSCIDRRSISLFDSSTLQSVVEGIQEIDIPELRRATRYIGWEASHRTVRDFWSIVKRFDFDQKKKLLEFVTASDRVPVGGMGNLQFTLQRNGVDDGHLPTSYTCYGILLLPEYSSKDVLRQKLAMALENSKGFGFA
ncbi:Oncogenic -associated E6-AP [Hyphodiscus hymeniophilus]|uniref:HECT-type E3 ubiquitin transferase n=1 Tax=Hyphodiscus hymeniophilus TaxID=353542 RepID=A0A9P6SL99_9HELO|nr:Oncogenic -associated E6-AP [Hyphodiscus hymeniophilus]